MMEMLTGGAAVGDYDNDGWEDIYFTVHDGRGVLYRNMGKTISPKVINWKVLENSYSKVIGKSHYYSLNIRPKLHLNLENRI